MKVSNTTYNCFTNFFPKLKRQEKTNTEKKDPKHIGIFSSKVYTTEFSEKIIVCVTVPH